MEIRQILGPLEVRFFGQFSGHAQETTKMCLESLLLHINVNFHHDPLKKVSIGQKLALKWTKTLTDLRIYICAHYFAKCVFGK